MLIVQVQVQNIVTDCQGQEVIHFPTSDSAACKSLPARAAFVPPSHSPALRCSSAPAAPGSGSAPCAALPDTAVTPGSSTATVPCHVAGCQHQHCHRHQARPPSRTPSPQQRVETLCSVLCLCGSQHRAVTHFIYNKCRSQQNM